MKKLLMTAAFLAGSAIGAQAATVPLSGSDFTYTGGGLQGGNCPFAAPCYRVNSNETLTVTYSGGPFTLTSFSYTLQGSPSSFDATTSTGGLIQSLSFSPPATTVISQDTSADGDFMNITSVTFTPTGTGTFRIGGLTGTAPMPAVPLPAAGVLLLTALGGFAAFGRRKA